MKQIHRFSQIRIENAADFDVVVEIDYEKFYNFLYGHQEPWQFVYNVSFPHSRNGKYYEDNEYKDLNSLVELKEKEVFTIKKGLRMNLTKMVNSLGLELEVENFSEERKSYFLDNNLIFMELISLDPIENGPSTLVKRGYISHEEFPILSLSQENNN